MKRKARPSNEQAGYSLGFGLGSDPIATAQFRLLLRLAESAPTLFGGGPRCQHCTRLTLRVRPTRSSRCYDSLRQSRGFLFRLTVVIQPGKNGPLPHSYFVHALFGGVKFAKTLNSMQVGRIQNPPPAMACRFESGLGYQNHIVMIRRRPIPLFPR